MTEYVHISGVLERDVRDQNPWWVGNPLPTLPTFKRWPFEKILKRLDKPIAPILVIKGPRQIGKTTLQLQVIMRLLHDGIEPTRILRIQFDVLSSLKPIADYEPILTLVGWYEKHILGKTLNDAAREGKPAYLFLDEAQNIKDWDVESKSLVDRSTVRILLTGSSALRIESGRDSLAGRIQTLEVGPFRLAEIAALREFGDIIPFQPDNGLEAWKEQEFWRELEKYGRKNAAVRDRAFSAYWERGGYPLAQINPNVSWQEIADQLTETIVRRVIQHDLRIGERGRKRDENLLEEIFRLACRYIGQAPSPGTLAKEIQIVLSGNVGTQRVSSYMKFLESSLLIRLIKPMEMRLKKRHAHPKICLSDHAIRAAWLQETVPLEATSGADTIVGRIAESIAGYYLASITSVDLNYIPAKGKQSEIDFVITAGDKRIPLEMKFRNQIDNRDASNLNSFIGKRINQASFGLVITKNDAPQPTDSPIVYLPLKTLLLLR